MPKRLIVCADGTWNDEDAASAPTNVAKLHLALQTQYVEGVEQRVFYHSGVGTSWAERLPGGAFGVGINRNIKDCYGFLVDNYAPGDELYFFGFSRGAYTVRSVAGLVNNSGIVTDRAQIDAAFELYRSRRSGNRPRQPQAIEFRRRHAHATRPRLAEPAPEYEHSPEIKFIGVWDTVGSLGYPIPFRHVLRPLLALFGVNWWFHDTNLSTTVQYAYHAVAIHERRSDFTPTLWTQQLKKGEQTPKRADQVLEQVYFPGVHCDVGGGYGGAALSDVTYRWMVEKAAATGLLFREQAVEPGLRIAPDPLGRLHESFNGFFVLLDALRLHFHGAPRHFERDAAVRDAAFRAAIADSAVERFERMPGTPWPGEGGADSFERCLEDLLRRPNQAQPPAARVLELLRGAPPPNSPGALTAREGRSSDDGPVGAGQSDARASL